ncbi:MAG TPA: hypothetical protein VJP86_17735 [Vicinamibacterales bacterium]|nr:hypothetical protein [Vicinamibacterales bacterium]
MKRLLLIALLIAALPYVRSPIYRFPPPTPFTGSQFYDPYGDAAGDWRQNAWQRTNLHAHSRAWVGLTNGQQSDEEVVRAYRALGYSVPGLSNYHYISMVPDGAGLPMYEHGYNLGKRHQLAVGARKVEWFDFPLFQSTNQKQFIIDLMKRNSELVGITHPSGRDSYSSDDLRQLTGYQLIEVVNGPFADDEPWDAALSTGRLVWGMANDDNHDINDRLRMGLSWNMVHSTTNPSDVLSALKGGHFYSVFRLDDHPNAALTEIANYTFHDGTLTITCAGAIPAFEFFGQNGVIKKTVRDTLTASYTFDANDTYIRTIIWAPRHVIYLNPIVRWDGHQVPTPVAMVDQTATWIMRLSVAGAAAFVVMVFRRPLYLTGPKHFSAPIASDTGETPA